jgi:hypothetical protein
MAGSSLAMAQTAAAPQASSQALVTAVVPATASTSEARLVLTFNKVIPQFSIITNDSDISVIAFTGSKLSPDGAPPSGKHGLIQAIGFTQTDGILTLTLTGPSRFTLSPRAWASVRFP